jgi:hypothetical protein
MHTAFLPLALSVASFADCQFFGGGHALLSVHHGAREREKRDAVRAI